MADKKFKIKDKPDPKRKPKPKDKKSKEEKEDKKSKEEKEDEKSKEEKEDEKFKCKLSILKILVNSIILETIGSIREAYSADESIRVEMDSVIIDNIEDALKKIEEFIPLCEQFLKYIDIDKFSETIGELEDLDVTLSKTYAEDVWNTLAPALLSI